MGGGGGGGGAREAECGGSWLRGGGCVEVYKSWDGMGWLVVVCGRLGECRVQRDGRGWRGDWGDIPLGWVTLTEVLSDRLESVRVCMRMLYACVPTHTRPSRCRCQMAAHVSVCQYMSSHVITCQGMSLVLYYIYDEYKFPGNSPTSPYHSPISNACLQ